MQSFRKRFTMDEGLSKAVHSTKKNKEENRGKISLFCTIKIS